MTCKGYDSKAIKIGKEVKRIAASYLNAHTRGSVIRSYVKIAEDASRMRTTRNRGKSV
jgi:hypothetical protein